MCNWERKSVTQCLKSGEGPHFSTTKTGKRGTTKVRVHVKGNKVSCHKKGVSLTIKTKGPGKTGSGLREEGQDVTHSVPGSGLGSGCPLL